MHLRFRQVRYFVEIVDAGSMTRAAERVNLAPTALSLQIRKLEDQFGVSLLERHARGVYPTTRGRKFYDSARRILDLLDETEQMLSSDGSTVATCRLGLSPSLLHTLDAGTLFPVFDGPNRLLVELVEGLSSHLMTRLESGEIDFALGWVGDHPPSVRVTDIAEEAIVFVTSQPPAALDRDITLEAAAASDLIRVGRHSMSWELVCRRAASAGLRMTSVRVVESADLVRRMLCDGLGTAILPVTFIDPERRAGDVHVHRLAGEPITRRLSLAWREAATPPCIDGPVIAYIDSVVRALHMHTMPYSRALVPVSAALAAPDAGAPNEVG